MLITGFPTGSFQATCFVLAPSDGADCVVIDPGEGAAQPLRQLLEERRLDPVGVLITHGHLDHTASVAQVCDSYGIPLYLHRGDDHMLDDPLAALSPQLRAALAGVEIGSVRPRLVEYLGDGGPGRADALTLAGLEIEVRSIPGHTPGSAAYLLPAGPDHPSLIFTGDTLFAGSIGRTDLPGGSMTQILESIRDRLLNLPDDTIVLPGHGPTTTIGAERVNNPFLI